MTSTLHSTQTQQRLRRIRVVNGPQNGKLLTLPEPLTEEIKFDESLLPGAGWAVSGDFEQVSITFPAPPVSLYCLTTIATGSWPFIDETVYLYRPERSDTDGYLPSIPKTAREA